MLHFLDRPKAGFANYWMSTGGQSTLWRQFFKDHSLRDPAEFQQLKRLSKAALQASVDEEEISDVALLTQTGYLTIKDVRYGDYYVGYPNAEVAATLGDIYSEKLLAGQSLNGIGAGNVAAVLAEGNPDTAMEVFNRMFLALDYQRYPVRDEFACRGFLQALLMGARLYSQIEVPNAFGRSDLEVNAGKKHWVFELKYLSRKETSTEKTAERSLAEAVAQIKSRRYGEQMATGELIRVAAVFSEETRGFVRWQLV